MQTHQPRKILHLDSLISIAPKTVAVRLIDGVGNQLLPTPLEVASPGNPQQVEQELLQWGHDCAVYASDYHSQYLCLPRSEQELHDTEKWCHYWFCHDDMTDVQGTFLHSESKVMTEIDMMFMLCALGYPRAVIIAQKDLQPKWKQVIFHHREPTMPVKEAKLKSCSPWPDRQGHVKTKLPLFHASSEKKSMPKCQLHTSYNCADLTQLFDSTNGMLCTDFSVLQLPDQIRATLDQLEHRPLHATHELDQYDRVLIFTDGSSRPSMKHYEAQHADELGYPDTWAMMVVGEIFDEKNHSQLVILGWASYPVRYDPNGSAYMGIKRIGSDMAERAGLIGAAMWRLSHNHQIPTIICTDSDTGGKQAFGAIGAQDNEESFQLLRSLYQTLEIGLPPGDLCLHHVTAHAGDIFNEIVDVAAKQEMKRSLHCPRQKLDLQVWRSKFLHLWTLFGHRIGLPLWQDGVMDIHAPDLPVLNSNAEHEDQVDENAYVEKIQFALSIATANVQSLSRGPQGHAGKLQYLQSQMRSFGLNCMAVQECRTDAGMSQNGDILRYCSGQNQGQYGIEVWIDLRQPYAWTPHGQQHHFHSSHFQCVHADPRRLFLRCDADNISFWLVAFHAPHSGHSQKTCEEWWQETSEILREQHDGDPVFVLCDANAAPGERDDCIVHEDGFKASANTPAFRSFLQEFQLYLPETTNVHDGTQVTWTDPQGKNGYTIDHVALPQDWHHRCVLSRVLTEFDLATLHEDHNAVVAQLQWARHLRRSATGSTTHRNLPPVEYYPGQGQAEAIKALETLPWYSDVETQAQHITQQLHGVLQQTAQQKKTKAKKHYMTDFIWDLRKAKCQAKKTVKQIKHRQKRDLLQECFSAWSKGSSYPDRDQHAAYAESLQCAMLKRVASYHDVSRKLKKEIMNSKQAALQQQLKQFDERTPAAEVLRNLKHFIGPTNPKKCKKKTLPLVRNDQGAICHLPSEATETWVAFFQRMEGGERMPYQELRKRWIAELEAFSHEHLQYDMESLPTLTDLEIAMRRVPRGKAKGPDGLPGELLHHQPAAVARLMYSQLMKMILHGHEFLGFKGGVLTPAYKGRGPYEACTSYRSLLVSNHLGKVMHRVIRQQKAQVYEAFLQGQQTGGRRKVPVQLAMHQVRAFARQAKRGGRSHSIIYLDLTEAFYTVLREMSLGGEPTDEVLAHVLHRLGLPPSAMHEIHDLLQMQPAVAQAGFNEVEQKCWQAIHTSTHFWIAQQRDVSRTRLGTRPGDSMADVVFGYTWGCILKKLQQVMTEHDAITEFEAHDHLPMFDVQHPHPNKEVFLGPTWMDDLAVCLQTDSPESLANKTAFVAGALLDLCRQHCLMPNLAQGKTEVQMVFRGPRSRKLKIENFGPNAKRKLPVLCEDGVKHLQLIQCYKHLGSAMHHTTDQASEIQQRSAIAHAAMNQHRRLLYQNVGIDFSKRKEIFDMLVMSKLLYGADSWVAQDQRTMKRFHSKVMQLYRSLLRLKPDEHISDEEVLVKAGALSPTELLSRARLRYIVTLSNINMPEIWGLFALDVQWRELLELDMIWMWEQVASTCKLPDPRQNYASWLYVIQQNPRFWKRLVRRACEHCILQRAKNVHVRQIHQQILERLWDLLPPQVPRPEIKIDMGKQYYGCMGCKLRCKSRAGEAAHMCKKHGVVSRLRQLADQPTCPACLRFFHTMQKLKAHLHYSRQCYQRLMNQQMRCVAAPGAGSCADQALTRDHDRHLPPLRGQGPLCEPAPFREVVDYDEGVFDFLTDQVSNFEDWESLDAAVRRHVQELAIEWTKFCATIKYFLEHFSEEDETFFHVAKNELTTALQRLGDPKTCDFLHEERSQTVTLETLDHLTEECSITRDMIEQHGIVKVPRITGTHRVVLHAYAGRRRVGDIQYYMDLMAEKHPAIILHVISLDIIINSEWGDVSNPQTSQHWLHAIRQQWVVAFIGGPPCETWSRARGKQIHYIDEDGNKCVKAGPRVIRSAQQPWGFGSAALKEIRQLTVGNVLLAFAIQAMLELAAVDGYGVLEHPADPEGEQDAASIWRLEVVRALIAMPHVQLIRVAQGLLGSLSPKPTHLLALNLPGLIFSLHAGRVRKELPTATAIGCTEAGTWRTAPLKEYAPAFCRCIANSLLESFSKDLADPSVDSLPAHFLARCRLLESTDFGDVMGADYACQANN